MLATLKKFVDKIFAPQSGITRGQRVRDIHLAAASLLAEVALSDGEFLDSERNRIRLIAERFFGIDEKEADAFVNMAIERANQSVDLHGFTHQLLKNFDYQERQSLIEMLWEVVYADGVVDDQQANLMRRITGLLGLTDRDSAIARQRVQKSLDDVGSA